MEGYQTHYPLIIVGAGPAGLMAAISAENDTALIIEKGNKPGRKLLITAAGQCNFTHRGTVPELLACYNGKENFLRPALYDFSNEDIICFFEDRGVPSFFDEKDRCLPRSLCAGDILRELIQAARDKGVTFHQNDGVISVESLIPGALCGLADARFKVNTKLRNFTCEKLILATGGKSYPKTGSTGDGYQLARQLGHSIIELRPALTAVESDNFPLSSLAGLSFDNIMVEFYRKGKMTGRYRGNLLITHKGLSGPVIINNSRYLLEGYEIRVNFTSLNREELNENMTGTAAREGKKTLVSYLKTLNIPRKLISFLIPPGDEERILSQLKKKERMALMNNLTAYSVPVTRLQGWETAMVTAGGVDTKEINPKTMESRLVRGLYFAGEIMDVDGDSGGYNLQAAFSTGWLAGKGVGKVG